MLVINLFSDTSNVTHLV